MNRTMTIILTYALMIKIWQQVENHETGILARSPLRKERDRHLTYLIKL